MIHTIFNSGSLLPSLQWFNDDNQTGSPSTCCWNHTATGLSARLNAPQSKPALSTKSLVPPHRYVFCTGLITAASECFTNIKEFISTIPLCSPAPGSCCTQQQMARGEASLQYPAPTGKERNKWECLTLPLQPWEEKRSCSGQQLINQQKAAAQGTEQVQRPGGAETTRSKKPRLGVCNSLHFFLRWNIGQHAPLPPFLKRHKTLIQSLH